MPAPVPPSLGFPPPPGLIPPPARPPRLPKRFMNGLLPVFAPPGARPGARPGTPGRPPVGADGVELGAVTTSGSSCTMPWLLNVTMPAFSLILVTSMSSWLWPSVRMSSASLLPGLVAGTLNHTCTCPKMEGTMRYGLRRRSRSGDGAFERTRTKLAAKDFRAGESGVALRLPPQSKTPWIFWWRDLDAHAADGTAPAGF